MASVSDFLFLNQQPAGGLVFCVKGTRTAAVGLDLPEVVKSCDVCLEAADVYYDQSVAWERTKNTPKARGDGEAMALDVLVDRGVSGVHTHAVNLDRAMPPESEVAMAAREFIRRAFPNGAEAITKLRHAEESVAVSKLVKDCKDPKRLAPLVATLGLTPLVNHLGELSVRFDAALRKSVPAETSWSEVKAAAAEAHERYAQLFAFIIGHYNLQTPEHITARTTLLKPILDQDYRVAEARRLRKPVVDVDPNTGEPVPMPTEPATPPAPTDHG
jgi:hypothetical protein